MRGGMRWDGGPLRPASPREALELGIGMVYQEMLSFPNLSVTANIFAGREITRLGRMDERAMRARTVALLEELHLPVNPDARAEALPAAHRQLLQVARAMAFDCRILVLDEPTTALTDAEADHLFAVVRRLKARGTTILYVSHRIPEVFRLCDRITVLRDGAFAGTFDCAAVAPERIVRAMVGRDLPPVRSTRQRPAGARDRSPRPYGRAVLPRRVAVGGAGEIVGLFGLVGSGRTELLEAIFGLRASGGGIRIDGRPVRPHSARDAARAGIALVPEERQRQGLFFNLTVRHNLMLPSRAASGAWRIDDAAERRETADLLRDWRIRAPGPDVFPDALSGGNQQKVVLAKWLATHPRVLLLDEPTKGVDVGAKFEIHEIIRRQASRGLACLVVSSDLPEVLAIADRIVVMREGRIQGELPGAGATEEGVMRLATADLKAAS
jgi:ABC-type sugar transport system ATPase subunit